MKRDIEKIISHALFEAEQYYPIEIVSSWITGSHHLGLAGESSDIDITGVYIQDPIELLRQKVSPEHRITIYKTGPVEVKLISLREFARDIKNSTALAFETLFCATPYGERILTLNGALKDLYFDLKDPAAQNYNLTGITCSAANRFISNKREGLDTQVKLLAHATKALLMAHLSRSKDQPYFNETVNLLKVAAEDPEVPQIIKDVFERYNSPELYHGILDEEGDLLFNKLSDYTHELSLTTLLGNRKDCGEEEFRAVDAKVDKLVMGYYRNIFYY